MKKIVLIILNISILLVTSWAIADILDNKKRASHTKVGSPNPSGVNCLKKGGTLKAKNSPTVCYFEDNKQCEVWALFRNECPQGGVKVTGLTKAARYCVLLGGKYQTKPGWVAKTKSDIAEEPGTCKLPNGKICDVWKLWDRSCTRHTN